MTLEKEPIFDEKMLAAIGELAVNWAHLEFGLDAIILVLYKAGFSEFQSELPRSLSRKLDFLREALKRADPSAVGDIASAFAFIETIRAESETRHDIIHGFPIHYSQDLTEVDLVRLLVQKDTWKQRYVSISIAGVMNAASRAFDLAAKAHDMAERMTKGFLSAQTT